MDKVAIFGDVHGESKMLKHLIEEIKKECGENVSIYSLGDLIDRGPDSSGVIDLCVKHDVKGIMGNHELWFRNLLRDRVFDNFALAPIMGGEKTFLSYNIHDFSNANKAALDLLKAVPKKHKDFLVNLPDYRVIDIDNHKYWLIHSGLSISSASSFRPLGKEISDEDMMENIIKSGKPENYIMWPSPPLPNKMRPQHRMFKFYEGTQILGHKPVKEPIVTKDFIAMDTGCGTCNPFTLSAVLLPSRKIIQVAEEATWTK